MGGTTPYPRFLVVDRHRQVLDALADLITDIPTLRLIAAVTTLTEAVPLARRHRPDVLLIDVDGLTVLDERVVSELRSALPAAQLIALTSYNDPGAAERTRRAGFDECIPKGAAVSQLLGRYIDH